PFALAVIGLQVLGSPLLAQVTGETERVALFALNHALSWAAALLGDVLGGVIPEAAGRLTHTSSASAGAIRSAFVAVTIVTLLSLPFVLRLARVAGLG